VRWRQRLQSYSRPLSLLRSALENGPEALNDLEKEGAVQRFEYTVELAWKVLKNHLELSGAQLASVTPKSVIKAGFAARIVSDGQMKHLPLREHIDRVGRRVFTRSGAGA
jgi:nucleotidyltransferase substrate binding protein (TIGR01987 family)